MWNKQILDRVLIANDLVAKAKGKNKEMLLIKVDFSKAYASVD